MPQRNGRYISNYLPKIPGMDVQTSAVAFSRPCMAHLTQRIDGPSTTLGYWLLLVSSVGSPPHVTFITQVGGVNLMVHGDDFIMVARQDGRQRTLKLLEKNFEIKHTTAGPTPTLPKRAPGIGPYRHVSFMGLVT